MSFWVRLGRNGMELPESGLCSWARDGKTGRTCRTPRSRSLFTFSPGLGRFPPAIFIMPSQAPRHGTPLAMRGASCARYTVYTWLEVALMGLEKINRAFLLCCFAARVGVCQMGQEKSGV